MQKEQKNLFNGLRLSFDIFQKQSVSSELQAVKYPLITYVLS